MGRTSVGRALTVPALVIVATAVLGAGAVLSLVASGAAEVSAPAVRGEQRQVTPTVPPPAGCHRVVVIGDSLMDNSRPWLVRGLADAGFEALVDAQPSRRIPSSVRPPYSGVLAAQSVRADFGDAECWVIALGSNDLPYGGLDAGSIGSWLDEMLAAVSPGARVWWVNLAYHRDPRWSFDFPRASALFNAELAERAAADAQLEVIDWHTLAEANLQWFFDPVHVDRTGSIARAELTVAALPRSG
jgi:hypothetical protein